MALEKITTVDKIEVLKNGCVQARTKTSIMEDGRQISGTFHRHVVAPGDEYSGEFDKVKAICAAAHTYEVISEYQKAQNKNGNL